MKNSPMILQKVFQWLSRAAQVLELLQRYRNYWPEKWELLAKQPDAQGSMAKLLRHWTLVLRVAGSRPTCAGLLFVPRDKALYSNCSVVRRSHKAVSLIWSTFYALSDVKECHKLFEKRRGMLPVTINRMSKYVTASRTRVGKGDWSPIKSPPVIVNSTSRGAQIEESLMKQQPLKQNVSYILMGAGWCSDSQLNIFMKNSSEILVLMQKSPTKQAICRIFSLSWLLKSVWRS